MPKSRSERELSRLELAVLGLVSKGAPCTTYWIRRQFQGSPSSYFSGSAGAVYPAVRRLEQRRLIAATTERKARRASRRYRLTPSGKRAIKAWLLPPLPAADVAFTMDPVRTRVYYLEALTAPERLKFVDNALAQARLQATLAQAGSVERREAEDLFDYLGSLGAVHEARARVRWLEQVRRTLEQSPG